MTVPNITALFDRHKGLLLALVAVVFAIVTLPPGLGRTGLWDPWEMDRAHVARQMAGGAGVVVLERETEGGELGPLAQRVRELGSDKLRVSTADAPTRHTTSLRLGLHRFKSVRTAVASENTHLVVLDLALVLPSLDDSSAAGEVIGAIEGLRRSQSGLRFGLDVSHLGGDVEAARIVLTAAAQSVAEKAAAADLEEGEEAPDLSPVVLEPGVVVFNGPQDEAFAELVDDIDGSEWWRAQFTDKGEVHSLPVLDYWLTALSYELFGFTETAARLPFLLWGLLGLLVVVLATRELFGNRVAAIAAMVLVTTPFYVGAARHVSGEISFAVTLAAGICGFLVLLRKGWSWRWFALFLAGALLAFLSNGLTALLHLWVVVLALTVATSSWRREALVPLGVLSVLFVGFVVLVLTPSEWTFFSHFKFMDRPFQGGPDSQIRSFDYFVRQIGFGAFPWSALLPFAFARLWMRGDQGEGAGNEAQHGVVLWFAVPLFLSALMLKDFSHCVYPGIPALAVAVAVFLDDLVKGVRPNGFVAFVTFILVVVLAKQIGVSAEPVAGYLTYDPHFDPKGSAFPEEVSFPRVVRYLALFGGFLLLVFGLKLGGIVRRGAQLLREPKPFWTAAFVLLVLFGVALVGTLMWNFEISLSRPEARTVEMVHRMAVRHVMLSAWAFVLYALLAVGGLLHLFVYSAWGRGLRERRRLFRWTGALSSRIPRVWFVAGLAGLYVVTVGLLFGGLASRWLELAAKLFPGQDDTGVLHLVTHNTGVRAALAISAVLVVNRLLVGPLQRLTVVYRALEVFERPAPTVAALILVALVFTVTTTQSVFADLSLHVSQKHVVESYLHAEDADELGDNIFKHGRFASSGRGDVNFYTNSIPEVSDRKTALTALLRQEDVTVRVADRKGGKRDILLHGGGADSERVYFLMPKKSFSEINHAFRKRSGGRPIPVLDAASSRLILAVSDLRQGESDENWLTAALTTEEEMKTRDWFPDSDGDVFHPTYVNFDDKIELLGYVLEHDKVSRRQDYNIKMFFRCKEPLRVSYKIFMHVDRSGSSHRIHSDHWPLNLEKSPGDDPEKSCRGCFQTRHWMPGDIYVDSFGREVPLGTPSGPQDIWIGFYNPTDQKRLKVKDFDKEKVQHDGSDRVKIGSFDV